MSLPKPYYEKDGIVIYHADCREVLPFVGEFDLCLTDPPYGVNLNYASHNDKSLVSGWLDVCRSIATCVIVTPGYVNTFKYPTPDHVAIRFDRTAQSPATIAWMNKWEPIFFYGKPGKLKLAWDVLETASQSERTREPLDHPCPKPLSLMLGLIGKLSDVTCRIIDPFMGSGTTLVAAKNLGRRAVGIEIEEKYCAIAVQRLSQEVMDFDGLQDERAAARSVESVQANQAVTVKAQQEAMF